MMQEDHRQWVDAALWDAHDVGWSTTTGAAEDSAKDETSAVYHTTMPPSIPSQEWLKGTPQEMMEKRSETPRRS